jgi:hypothetical protein
MFVLSLTGAENLASTHSIESTWLLQSCESLEGWMTQNLQAQNNSRFGDTGQSLQQNTDKQLWSVSGIGRHVQSLCSVVF